MQGAAELIEEANSENIPVAVITNQSGIDRGMFGWRDFAGVTERIDALLAVKGAVIDAVAACPFHPDFTSDFSARHAEWRKPAPRMIEAIATGLNADRARSWMIGNSGSDMEAAEAAGLAGGILIGGDQENRPGTFVVIASALDKIVTRGWLRPRSAAQARNSRAQRRR